MRDVCNLEGSGLLSIDAALAQIQNALTAVKETEKVSLKNALGRVLATQVKAEINLPTDRNSAMDGYAFSSRDIIVEQTFALKKVGASWAGKPFAGDLKTGECVRIFTGAVLPDGADSVIMQEQILTREHNYVLLPEKCQPFQNVREIGEDVKQGSVLFHSPKKLTAADLGLLAAAGVDKVEVNRKLNIAFFSTGDELVALGEPLKTGQIYDSNRYTLHGLLNNPSFLVSDNGVIPDDKILVQQALLNAAETADVIITTGGASVGDADYIQEVLADCGKVNFWKIAMKPGKPLAFGSIGKCTFFGLPGNPIAVMATFDKIVSPALRQLSGEPARKPLQLKAICQSPLKKAAGRQEYQRGILEQRGQGLLTVQSAGRQGSNILSAMSRANCYIVLPSECCGVQIGDEVIVEPFDILI